MAYWTREIAGWILVALGLLCFYVCYAFLAAGYVIQAGPMTVIAFVVFRGGIHLLKVAVAARVCLHANDKQPESERRPLPETRWKDRWEPRETRKPRE